MTISLITPSQLEQLLSDPLRLKTELQSDRITLVDGRPKDEYEEGHIPAAIRVAWEDWCEKPKPESKEILTSPGYWGTLDDPYKSKFAERLAALGIVSD